MKQGLLAIFIFVLIVLPFSVVSATTDPGVKPSSFFYGFDTFFEKLDLFFTFSAEKKANKALEYAEERLSEAKEEADDNKPKGVEEAMKNYETNMSLATEKSKELENESETEKLLNTISSNALKHQEVLKSVYGQVPGEAKEAILKAIEISHNRQEEAVKQIGALKKEVAQLKDEIGQLQEKLKEKNVEQKPSPIPSQKQGSELKKPTQTLIPSIVTPTSDKSLKELKEELEKKLWELEKTPTPTFTPTSTPILTPTPIVIPATTPSVTPTKTPTPSPTPLSTPNPTPIPTPSPMITVRNVSLNGGDIVKGAKNVRLFFLQFESNVNVYYADLRFKLVGDTINNFDTIRIEKSGNILNAQNISNNTIVFNDVGAIYAGYTQLLITANISPTANTGNTFHLEFISGTTIDSNSNTIEISGSAVGSEFTIK